MKKETKKELCAIVLLAALLLGFIAISTAILMPKRLNYGSTWGSYLKEEQNSIDVLFFGSSISYCDVIPPVIWENSGITSYVMAGPEQTIPITYYYVRETMKTQKPKVIFVEVTGVFFKEYQDFTKVNIGYMPWGKNRLSATFHAAESKERTGLLFPLYNYHSRWDTIEPGEVVAALIGYSADDLAGYTFLDAAKEMAEIQPRNEGFNEDNYIRNIDYLKKIANLCEKQGVKPVYYIAPTYWSLSDEHLTMLKADIGEIDNVYYIDFNESGNLSAYDSKLDYYDLLHFNYRGAKKFSGQLAEMLSSELKLTPTKNVDEELWDTRLRIFNNMCSGS